MRRAAAANDGAIRIYNVSLRKLVADWIGHVDGAWTLVFDPERNLLLSGGADEVRFWEVGTWRLRGELSGHGSGINAMATEILW